ncbi:MAG: hypothetical protein KBS65_06275 [Prevotella sp.]|nr:hypothetical protein [Candidatus Equicola stercoris]
MKRVFFTIVAIFIATVASAQFTKGTKYANLSLSSLDLSYSGAEKFHFGLEAMGGYFLMDKVSANALLEFDNGGDAFSSSVTLGVQGRYYISQNGIYLAAGVKYKHVGPSYDDFLPGIEVGYAYYVNHYIAIEPAIYYDQSFKNHSDFSKIGLKIGAGFYF